MKYTSLRIREDKKLALQQVAIEISYNTGIPISWSELAHYILKEHLDDVKREL